MKPAPVLRENLERNEAVDLKGSVSVNAPVTALPSNHNLSEVCLPEQSLRKALKSGRW